uniref:Uncharacterized protein n=1 Tax=Arundo donax TaxID=35708 RepID=A0A0A8Y8Z9_ARUDO
MPIKISHRLVQSQVLACPQKFGAAHPQPAASLGVLRVSESLAKIW